jgi:mono/diheme cytochrome c family protein
MLSHGVCLKNACLLILGLCLGCAILAAKASNATSPVLISDPVYQKNCAKCHGRTATGHHFGGPSLLSAKAYDASVEELRTVIENGKGRMPKFANKLAPVEIDQLIMKIKALGQK